MRFELVIFDCDGVLVDSEPIATRVLAAAAARVGWVVGLEEAARAFPKGGALADCVATIERRIGRAVPGDFVSDYRAELYRVLRAEVRGVAGVAEALARIVWPVCVASNGPLEKIRASLGTAGLLAHFGERIFSAYSLERFKPHPDLYEHAARSLGASPASCVVVEDSVPGVQAGRAAGMRVLGYGTDEAERELLAVEGAEPFGSMAALPSLLGC